jgi:hypothetical protein
MRSLDDILIGFIIFFILERIIKLIGAVIFEPMIMKKTNDEKVTKNWVQAIDIALLLIALFLVIKYQKPLASLAKVA